MEGGWFALPLATNYYLKERVSMKIKYVAIGLPIGLVMSFAMSGPGLFTPRAVAQGANTASGQDTAPPETPRNFKIEGRDSSRLRLTWDWVADVGGYVDRYELKYNGQTTAFAQPYPGYWAAIAGLNVQPGNAYTFELWAIDTSGNRSQAPARLVFETTPPGQASSLRLLDTRAGYPDHIAFTGAPDNSGRMFGYEIFLDGQLLGTTRAASQFSLADYVFYIACIDPPSGPAQVQLRAIDSSLNYASQLSAPLTVVFP
jgi:hypothetical protein